MTYKDDFCRTEGEDAEHTPDFSHDSVFVKPGWDTIPKAPAIGADVCPRFPQDEIEAEWDARAQDGDGQAECSDFVDRQQERGPCSLGIRLRKAGQVFFFPSEEHSLRIGSKVIVEMEYGSALGEVESIVYGIAPTVSGEDATQVIGRVTGPATAQDIALHTENSILCAEAAAFCQSCIRQRKLDMKLVDVEVFHDRSKIQFYFTAPVRIDFRELVKDLVRNYRTRIELRQIGVRHETQMIGGIGNCGMVCCCHKYLRKFAPVTIKMAKEQKLFLNPAKLSGMCGRLLCCLSFEQDNYEEFNSRCPKLGKRYTTDTGTVKILRANMFSQSIVVLSETGEETEFSLKDWDNLHPRRADPPVPEQQRAVAQRNGVEGRKAGAGADADAAPGNTGLDSLNDDGTPARRQSDARSPRSRKQRGSPD